MGGRAEWTEPSGGSVTWVTVREAAKQAGVSESRVRRWYRAGRVRSRNRVDVSTDRRPQRRLVVAEDVLAQAERAREAHRTPTDDVVLGGSSREAIDRDEAHQLMDLVEILERLMTEVARVRERALREEEERSLLSEAVRQLQRRVERLEHLYPTAEWTTASAVHQTPADDASLEGPDVEVEWGADAPEEPSRFGFLRRRDHRS
jgi:hypothetical protein